MATFSTSNGRAHRNFPVHQPQGLEVNVAWGVYEAATTVYDASGDVGNIIQFCRIPKCTVVDGFFTGDDPDSGTEEFEMDIGYAANGTDAADPDAFLNSGVITGDANNVLIAGIFRMFFTLNALVPVSVSEETIVQGQLIAEAASAAGGTFKTQVYYVEHQSKLS